MKRKLLMVLLLCVTMYSCNGFTKQGPEGNKPNIILIMADDLGYETLGVYGGESYRTPNLDKLADEGMRFEYCYSTPLCTPSRVQIMTGKYNFRNYIGFGLLDPREKTFAHYMQESGYKTDIAGKWQLLGNGKQRELAGNKTGTRPLEAGFDDYCLWQIDQLGSRYKDPLLSSENIGTEKYKDRYGPDVFVDHIERFMEEHRESPMFIYYPMVLTHDPFVPTPESQNFVDFDARSKVNNPVYFSDMVSYTDKLVGRIVQKTEELGIRENTLILFAGDNGTDHDVTSVINGRELQGDKGHTTNAGTHVPLIANWKGNIAEGSVNRNLIDFTDFLPTLLEAASHDVLDSEKTDGLSFYPQLLGKETKTRDWIFCHYDPNWGNFEPKTYVQDKIWKLYSNGSLFNLQEDPLEKNPVDIGSQTESAKAVVNNLRDVLTDLVNQREKP